MIYQEEKKKTKKELAKEKEQAQKRKKLEIEEAKNDFNYIMGFIVSKLREEKGMTIEQLAKRIDVTSEYLEKCEKGQVAITILNMLDFCLVFEKSITSMLGDTAFTTSVFRTAIRH